MSIKGMTKKRYSTKYIKRIETLFNIIPIQLVDFIT